MSDQKRDNAKPIQLSKNARFEKKVTKNFLVSVIIIIFIK